MQYPQDSAKIRILRLADILHAIVQRFLRFWMPWTTETEPRASLEKQIREMQIQQEKSYLILRNDSLDDDGYIYYMYTYTLNPKKMQFCTEYEFENGKYIAEDYDFVIQSEMRN